MKKTYLWITLISAICSAGCKKSNVLNPQQVSTTLTYSLTVNTGSGSGTFHTGDTAFVFSDPPSTTQVFDKWTGDVTSLVSPNEWRSAVKMPSSNVSVTATYKTVPNITFTNTVINGSQVYYYVPASYRGVLLTFHGTGGSAINWVSQQAEDVNFCRYAAANGYALVITESKDRVNMQWDLSLNNNTDIANIDVILKTLQNSGIISATKPLYGLGMSNGSAFCSLIAYLRRYKASALYCYGGIDKVFPLTNTPTIWNMAGNDVTDDPNRQITAFANCNVLKSRGIAVQYYVNTPTPLYASRFDIIPSVTSTASTNIYNALKTGGYLNSKGFFNVDPAVNSALQSVIPAPYNPLALQPIGDQLYVAYAQHKFYKDSNYRTISFFNQF